MSINHFKVKLTISSIEYNKIYYLKQMPQIRFIRNNSNISYQLIVFPGFVQYPSGVCR